jgi:TRAP-type C4-dicarboxylate transport system permease small subunit
MKYLDKIFGLVMKIYLIIAKILLVAMVVIIGIQVFFRYVLNRSIAWSEEIAMLFMVIFGFISIAIGVERGLHLSISLFYQKFPNAMKLVVDKISNFIVMCIGGIMLFYGVPLLKSTMNSIMPGTGLPAATLYSIVPVTGLLIAYYSFAELIGHRKPVEQEYD